MRKVIRWACVSLSVLVAMAATAVWTLFQAAHQAPRFYQEALRVAAESQSEIGDRFEQEVLELRNDSREAGAWEAVFTAEQLNGWLAVDLPEKFPNALPPGLEDPRILIEADLVRVACRYHTDSLSTVLSFALAIQMSDEPNTVAIQIRHVRAGAVPVPLGVWLPKLQESLLQTDLPVRWGQLDADPVALIHIPDRLSDPSQQMISLESVLIEPGLVRLSGRTAAPDEPGDDFKSPQPTIVQRPPGDRADENVTTQR